MRARKKSRKLNAVRWIVPLLLTVPATLRSNGAEATKRPWPYTAVSEPGVPAVRDGSWPKNPIDRFVLAAMEREGLTPVEAAEPRVLIRRIYFDLLGLPPAPDRVAAFEEAAKADLDAAIESLVDELLASPAYGERWARHWLDVARYAEDQAHKGGRNGTAFQYRDWVVRAFNDDMPLADFVRRQIAGDLLPVDENETIDDRFVRLGGLGFFGLGAVYYKNSDREKAAADELDDRIDTFTRGFLALTVSCARCHDHKFDPISIEDYYSVAGIFKGSNPRHTSIGTPKAVAARNKALAHVKEQERVVSQFLDERGRRWSGQEIVRLASWLRLAWKMRMLEHAGVKLDTKKVAAAEEMLFYFAHRWREHARRGKDLLDPALIELFQPRDDAKGKKTLDEIKVPAEIDAAILAISERAQEARRRHLAEDEKPSPEGEKLLQSIWFRGNAPLKLDAKHAEQYALSDAERGELATLRKELEARRKLVPSDFPKVPSIAGHGNAMQVILRGDPAKKGSWVARGFLEVLAPGARPKDPEKARAHEFTRLELADAIAASENPLTTRVFVNRIWQWRFGRGIVGTTSNFGELGDRPTHPKLLDWLARRFDEGGQSTKQLHRMMLTSATYRLASSSHAKNLEVDAEGRWLWRWNRRRLDVESMRDSFLSVSGELDARLGGQTSNVSDAGNRRRTVYASISRHQLNEFLRTFDFPDANVTAAGRLSTTVPQQQLFALNSPFMIERAKAFAARLSKLAEQIDDRIRQAYRLAFSREPTSEELEIGRRFISAPKDEGDSLPPWVQYTQALLATNEFIHVD